MQSIEEISQIQDNASQALTEVALGLSMAFFALLIIALFSVSMPNEASNIATESVTDKKQTERTLNDLNPEVSLASTSESSAATASANQRNKANEAPLLVLYWGGRYFDSEHRSLSVTEIQNAQNVIIAVDPLISFEQLIKVQATFSGKEMRLTSLTPEWIKALNG